MYMLHFVFHSSVNEYLSCFCLLAIVNYDAINAGLQVFEFLFEIILVIQLGMEFLSV
jgi:hypothetical protein